MNATPIHPLRLCEEVKNFMQRDAILVPLGLCHYCRAMVWLLSDLRGATGENHFGTADISGSKRAARIFDF